MGGPELVTNYEISTSEKQLKQALRQAPSGNCWLQATGDQTDFGELHKLGAFTNLERKVLISRDQHGFIEIPKTGTSLCFSSKGITKLLSWTP